MFVGAWHYTPIPVIETLPTRDPAGKRIDIIEAPDLVVGWAFHTSSATSTDQVQADLVTALRALASHGNHRLPSRDFVVWYGRTQLGPAPPIDAVAFKEPISADVLTVLEPVRSTKTLFEAGDARLVDLGLAPSCAMCLGRSSSIPP